MSIQIRGAFDSINDGRNLPSVPMMFFGADGSCYSSRPGVSSTSTIMRRTVTMQYNKETGEPKNLLVTDTISNVTRVPLQQEKPKRSTARRAKRMARIAPKVFRGPIPTEEEIREANRAFEAAAQRYQEEHPEQAAQVPFLPLVPKLTYEEDREPQRPFPIMVPTLPVPTQPRQVNFLSSTESETEGPTRIMVPRLPVPEQPRRNFLSSTDSE